MCFIGVKYDQIKGSRSMSKFTYIFDCIKKFRECFMEKCDNGKTEKFGKYEILDIKIKKAESY